MVSRRRLGKKLLKSLLPILLVLVIAAAIALASIVYGITRPPRRGYLVTPQDFSQISGTALKVTDENWRNRDGSSARGWLLRGTDGAPAVVLLHRYGGDRSELLNLGIKINETTNFTILWPDLRAHGMNPAVRSTTFGVHEGEDLLAALDFLRGLKNGNQNPVVGNSVGIYGVELGALAGLRGASQDSRVQVLVLDSVPGSTDEMVNAAVTQDVGVNNRVLLSAARFATRVYFLGRYKNQTSCELASMLKSQKIFLLAGMDGGYLRESTAKLGGCFSNPANLEVKTDLPLTGFSLRSATGEQGERYDRPVIDFFQKNLR